MCFADLIYCLGFLLSKICFCLCRAKYAIGAIKKKLNDKNPHVALYALEVRRCVQSKMSVWFKKMHQNVSKLNKIHCSSVCALRYHVVFGENCFGEMCITSPFRSWSQWWRTVARQSTMRWRVNKLWRNWRICSRWHSFCSYFEVLCFISKIYPPHPF